VHFVWSFVHLTNNQSRGMKINSEGVLEHDVEQRGWNE
jgi:hypothetical protein